MTGPDRDLLICAAQERFAPGSVREPSPQGGWSAGHGKLDMAGETFVINADAYIGFCTRSEIGHAAAAGKAFTYLERLI